MYHANFGCGPCIFGVRYSVHNRSLKDRKDGNMFDTIVGEKPMRLYRAVEGVAQLRPMARNYRITDPEAMALKFGDEFEVRIVRGLKTGKIYRNPFVSGLVVQDKHAPSIEGGYVSAVSILCAHDGRHALRMRAGVLRLACANQFFGSEFSIAHTSAEIDLFLDNPAKVVREFLARSNAPLVAERVESLRGVGANFELLNALSIVRPRLGSRAIGRYFDNYATGDQWGIVQALTGVHNRSLDDLAARLIGPDFEEFKAGGVPACVYQS